MKEYVKKVGVGNALLETMGTKGAEGHGRGGAVAAHAKPKRSVEFSHYIKITTNITKKFLKERELSSST